MLKIFSRNFGKSVLRTGSGFTRKPNNASGVYRVAFSTSSQVDPGTKPPPMNPAESLLGKNHSRLLVKKNYSDQCPKTLLTSYLNPKIGFMGHSLAAEIFDYIMNESFLSEQFPFLQFEQHKDLMILDYEY